MPKVLKSVERICAYCRFYKLSVVADPFCEFWDREFPNARMWTYNPKFKMPGERTCGEWKQKKVVV